MNRSALFLLYLVLSVVSLVNYRQPDGKGRRDRWDRAGPWVGWAVRACLLTRHAAKSRGLRAWHCCR